MARFFIDRPIFAWVIAIIIMLAGVLSIFSLPIAQYPQIAPTTITINTSYPGASAKMLEDSVTQVIEQRLQGLDHLLYLSSTSDAAGNVNITLTFDVAADPDIAQVQVQNKVQQAMSRLPAEVQQQGVIVDKSTSLFMTIFAFLSDDPAMTSGDIADYIGSNIQDTLSRVPGVGSVELFGSPYAMRIWLDPAKLENFKMIPSDVATAIHAQNAQVSAGQIGGTPSIQGQRLNVTVTAQSRLQTAEQFENIILRSNTDGSLVRLRDVARVELGNENYSIQTRVNGKPSSALAVSLATGANALEVVTAVRAKLAELAPYFPAGMSVVEPFDTTPFVKISIEEVVKTLLEAILLVFLVMYLFLQDMRATLIPTLAVPVVLLGTFAALAAFGFSINTLTMFGIVLAIGLLVDDAIVVVENVERVMHEEHLSPKEATKKSMDQITGALVGIAMVLSAVFLPMAFFGGSVGVIYQQFSITIIAAMTFSVIVAVIFTPALCATMLKAKGNAHTQRGFFGWFNRMFDRGTLRYQNIVAASLRRTFRVLFLFLIFIGGTFWLFRTLPSSFLPDEDQGILMVMYTLPAGATQEESEAVAKKIEDYFTANEKDTIESLLTVAGFSFNGNGQNTGMAFARLKDWTQREEVEKKVAAIVGRSFVAFSQIREAMIFPFQPPAIMELGNGTGFTFQLQDRANMGHEALIAARNQLLGMAAQSPLLVRVRPNGLEDTPQYSIEIDREKAGSLGLSLESINNTLSTAWGSAYVDDFLDNGRVKRVYMQGEIDSRMTPEDFNKWYFRNNNGDMVPFSAIGSASWTYGPSRLERYNGISSVSIQGESAPGVSSGAAMIEMERLAAQLPPGFGYEWTGLSYQERLSGDQAPMLYALSILVVFLCLAALYESWSVPISVLLVVPLGVFGALAATYLRGLSNDVYFQVAMLATIGLSAKNAILIVEFAKDLHAEGKDLIMATVEASRMRLRPILMTSLAFLLGVLPLAISTGAGSGSQNAIGTGIIGGTFAATALGIFFVPVFFVVVVKLFSRNKTKAKKTE